MTLGSLTSDPMLRTSQPSLALGRQAYCVEGYMCFHRLHSLARVSDITCLLACRYEHLWDNVSAPLTPNYNASSPGKPQHIRQNPPLSADVKCWQDQVDAWHCRTESEVELNMSLRRHIGGWDG